MKETVFQKASCAECLKVLIANYRKDYREFPLCEACIESYYAACARCSLLVAVDEAAAVSATGGKTDYYCSKCKSGSEQQSKLDYPNEEVARLVDEFVMLHAEEKRVKEQMESVKQQLKEIAETQSGGGSKPVTLTGSGGEATVKCSYRTNLKADAEKVSELRDCLGQELFSTLFSEKTTFDVNKSNFEKLLSPNADLPEDVRRQIADAVKISVSATLNVA